MNKKKTDESKYTIPNRLTDVIRLISVLAMDEHTFRTKEGLDKAIRGNPLSAADWIQIASEHPEFFRPNGDGFYIALLLRSYFKENQFGNGAKTKECLTQEQTQKLIEAAISLHDKEIARIQKYSFRIPIRTAIIAGCAVVLASLISTGAAIYLNIFNSNKVEILQKNLDRIESKIDKIK